MTKWGAAAVIVGLMGCDVVSEEADPGKLPDGSPDPWGEKCDIDVAESAFSMSVEWSFEGQGDEIAALSVPAVADVTGDGIPDVVAVLYVPDDYFEIGHIYLLDGRTGELHRRFEEPVAPTTHPAVGDIDGDGDLEIVAFGPSVTGRLLAFEADGSLIWEGETEFHGGQYAIGLADMVDRAENLHPGDYEELVREANTAFANKKSRRKQPRVKEEVVCRRGFLNKRLLAEDTAEFEYKPHKATKSYRIVVLRKLVQEERGQQCVGVDFKYFFYITNDRKLTQREVIAESNDRCDQERTIGQLKSGTRALHAPVNTLNANWAYMVMTALAWTLKAWFALLLPVSPRWREQHEADRSRLLRIGFKTFVQALMLIPAQIVCHGRRLIIRLLSWKPDLPVLFRFMDTL